MFEPFEANSIITPAHVVTPLSVRTAPGPKDISQTIDEGPTQPKLKCYQYQRPFMELDVLAE